MSNFIVSPKEGVPFVSVQAMAKMIHEYGVEQCITDLVDALEELGYNFSEKVSLEEHIEIVEDHGYQVLETKDSYKDIVSQAMAHQWMELFEEMTMQQRDLYINQIRGTYER